MAAWSDGVSYSKALDELRLELEQRTRSRQTFRVLLAHRGHPQTPTSTRTPMYNRRLRMGVSFRAGAKTPGFILSRVPERGSRIIALIVVIGILVIWLKSFNREVERIRGTSPPTSTTSSSSPCHRPVLFRRSSVRISLVEHDLGHGPAMFAPSAVPGATLNWLLLIRFSGEGTVWRTVGRTMARFHRVSVCPARGSRPGTQTGRLALEGREK